jgi:hypothetical protein
MSQQYPNYTNGPAPQGYQPQPAPNAKPPKKPMSHGAKIGWAALAGAGIFIVGVLAGNAGAGAQPAASSAAKLPAPTVTVTAPAAEPPAAAEETSEPAAPTYGVPKKTDFKLTVKQLTKKCFGSAGCNVTYRILVSYGGATLDPDATYEVLYRVKGGEDGPVDNKLTVTGDQSSVDEEEMVSTKSTKTKLSVVVTDVLAS